MLHEAVLKKNTFSDIDPGNHALRTEPTDQSLSTPDLVQLNRPLLILQIPSLSK